MKIILVIVTTLIVYFTSIIERVKHSKQEANTVYYNELSESNSIKSKKERISNMKNYSVTKLSSRSVVIEIEATNLTIEEQKEIFGKTYNEVVASGQFYIVQEQDFFFEFDRLISLGLDTSFPLFKKGKYPIEIVNDLVLVKVILEPNYKVKRLY